MAFDAIYILEDILDTRISQKNCIYSIPQNPKQPQRNVKDQRQSQRRWHSKKSKSQIQSCKMLWISRLYVQTDGQMNLCSVTLHKESQIIHKKIPEPKESKRIPDNIKNSQRIFRKRTSLDLQELLLRHYLS